MKKKAEKSATNTTCTITPASRRLTSEFCSHVVNTDTDRQRVITVSWPKQMYISLVNINCHYITG